VLFQIKEDSHINRNCCEIPLHQTIYETKLKFVQKYNGKL